MRYGSVCSGIEAATVAWRPLGWKAVFFSEIDPFPCAVLKHYYPDVPNLGDMTRFKEWPDADIDVLVGGTPCQSFSIAGLRKGLDDPRGNLMLTYLAIADRYRPKWLVWENVPGVLSSGGGRDFGTFLGGLAELGYGFSYRVLDAQFFGVSQRRRRVFVVGHLGDWRLAAAVLFERHSLQGHTPPGREERQKIAEGSLSRALSRVGGGDDPGANKGAPIVCMETAALTCGDRGMSVDQAAEGMAVPMHTTGQGDSVPCVAFSCKDHGADAGETAPTLRSMNHDGSHANGGGQVAVAFQPKASVTQSMNPSEICPTLGTTKEPAVAFQPRIARNGRGNMGDTVNALQAQSGESGKGDAAPCIATKTMVRRLTPRECERLQGFPDDYTLIPWRTYQEAKRKGVSYESLLAERGMKLREPAGEDCPDGPRYKALGNSMARPCMYWLGSRIQMVEDLTCSS